MLLRRLPTIFLRQGNGVLQIFLDLLHRTNGDTDAALEIMRNLGLGIGSDEIHRAEKSYRQLTCQPNTTASHNTTSPSSAPAPPTASITQARVEHPHQQPVADPGPGPCLHSPQQFSISGAAAVGTVLSPNTHGPQESNDRAQDMTRSGTLILSPPLRRGPPMVLVRSYQVGVGNPCQGKCGACRFLAKLFISCV